MLAEWLFREQQDAVVCPTGAVQDGGTPRATAGRTRPIGKRPKPATSQRISQTSHQDSDRRQCHENRIISPGSLGLLAAPLAGPHARLDALVARERRTVARPPGIARFSLGRRDIGLLAGRVERLLGRALSERGLLGRQGEEEFVGGREGVVRERKRLAERVVKGG